MSARKIGENTTNILKLLFFIINLHSITSNQISTYRKLNLPLTSSINFIFLTLEMQKKTQPDHSIPHIFLLCLKRNGPQAFKSGSCSVYVIATTYFDECFLLYVITGRHCFSWKFATTLRFFKHHAAAFFEASVLKEVRILCFTSTITIPKFQNKAEYASLFS